MDDASFNRLLSWGTGDSAEFPEFDFDLFDSVFSFDNQDQPIEEVPEFIADYQPAAQETVKCLSKLVDELSSRVTALENQLQSECRKREVIEQYIEDLQPFLAQLSLAIQN